MNLDSIITKPYILALFKRDDGVRFLLGSGAYEFKESQTHFVANTFTNDVVEMQGSDGALLAGQVRRAQTQPFDGFVGDGSSTKTQIETYRINFLKYFQKNHFYTVIYVFSDGTAIQRRRGYIVDSPEVRELYQMTPEYHIALNFEDVNYYKYAEDSQGDEAYSNRVAVPSDISAYGGVIWDEYGATWDNYGLIWEEGGGGGQTVITVDSITNVLPTISITGPSYNPIITNITTGQSIKYYGNILSSQTLAIDVSQKTAKLNGTSVIQNVDGDWLELAPGNNRITYTIDNQDQVNAIIEWQEIVG